MVKIYGTMGVFPDNEIWSDISSSNQSQCLTTPLQISCVEVPRQSSNGVLNSISDLFDLMAAGKVHVAVEPEMRLKIQTCMFTHFSKYYCQASMTALSKAARNLLAVPSFLVPTLAYKKANRIPRFKVYLFVTVQ